MKNNFNFIKDMIIGGILFFIPLIILIVILQKALQIAICTCGSNYKVIRRNYIFLESELKLSYRLL